MRLVSTLFLGILFGISTAAAGPLHDAARDGDSARAVQAIDKGAAIAEPDETGEPPLLIAALAGHKDIVVLLLDRGADIEIRNKGGLTALHAAAYGGHLDIVELLISKGAVINDEKNFYHMSPLHAAAEEGHADIVAFLLANKADIEAKERNGYTPLTQAGWRSHWDAAVILLRAGAVCQKEELVGEWLYGECMKRK
ncbi:ankyrin repeat domain-containing protein [Rhizobium sp. KVB221]|uniref:Ankyrin repeat domain-containing protein n=1 Tax=Rhizobium setariae TaxID=2801340 RepID=A0A936YM53_9HYPH|nr:ankyrin repeat domain-containing protein [Rhizobium setariae]